MNFFVSNHIHYHISMIYKMKTYYIRNEYNLHILQTNLITRIFRIKIRQILLWRHNDGWKMRKCIFFPSYNSPSCYFIIIFILLIFGSVELKQTKISLHKHKRCFLLQCCWINSTWVLAALSRHNKLCARSFYSFLF